jgi:hypothetical protein
VSERDVLCAERVSRGWKKRKTCARSEKARRESRNSRKGIRSSVSIQIAVTGRRTRGAEDEEN